MRYLKRSKTWLVAISVLLMISLILPLGGCGEGAKETTVTGVSPASGKPGQTLSVTITGTHLTGATGVSFGSGVTVSSFNVASDTQITASIAVGASAEVGSRDVLVTTEESTGAKIGGFTVESPLAPSITGISPSSAVQGEILDVTISGSGFSGTTAVDFGPRIITESFNVDSDSQVTASLSISTGATSGSRDVSVTNPSGPGSMTGGFTVNKHESFSLDILGPRTDMHGYTISYGLSQLINDHSEWLGATTYETPGMSTAMGMLVEEGARRTNTIVCITADPWQESMDLERWGPYDTLKFVASMGPTPVACITLDPNIKTIADLAGKTVGVHRPGTNMGNREMQLFEAAGVEGVEFYQAGFGGQAAALANGQIAASFQDLACVGPDEYEPGVTMSSLLAGKDIYWVDITEAAIQGAHEDFDSPYAPQLIPGGMFGPHQPSPIWVLGQDTFWACDAELDADVVYEVCRILAEYYQGLQLYHVAAKAIFPGMLGQMQWYSADAYHPGAARYFTEHDIPMEETAWHQE